MPLDAETLTNLRNTFPPPKAPTKYALGQSVIVHSIDTVVTPPIQVQTVTQPVDRIGGGETATNSTERRSDRPVDGPSGTPADRSPSCTSNEGASPYIYVVKLTILMF